MTVHSFHRSGRTPYGPSAPRGGRTSWSCGCSARVAPTGAVARSRDDPPVTLSRRMGIRDIGDGFPFALPGFAVPIWKAHEMSCCRPTGLPFFEEIVPVKNGGGASARGLVFPSCTKRRWERGFVAERRHAASGSVFDRAQVVRAICVYRCTIQRRRCRGSGRKAAPSKTPNPKITKKGDRDPTEAR